jgi:hypothetical protein
MVTAALVAAALGGGCDDAQLVRRVQPGVVRTSIVCDGVVVRRARFTHGEGRVITAVATAGERIAWGELRRADRRWTATVRLRGARGRVVARDRRRKPQLDVVVTTRGETAWMTGGRVFAARPGRKPRVLGRSAFWGLGIEDDRTVRWRSAERDEPRFADLRPWRGPGCPPRKRYRTEAESPEILVTRAWYGIDAVWDVMRICVRATGRDPVRATALNDYGSGTSLRGATIAGPWVVVLTDVRNRYTGCDRTEIAVLRAGSRSWLGRSGAVLYCDGGLLPATPPVVTESGAPAWIARNGERSAVVTTAGYSVITLDTAGLNGITNLTADGTAIHWLHDGAPRSADLG